MFASIRYIQTHHSFATIEGQPDQNPHPTSQTQETNAGNAPTTNGNAEANADQTMATSEPAPDTPEVFQAALRELSRDLIMKEQQIEYLVGVLPGIGTSERDQNERIQALEVELRQVEQERRVALQERDDMVDTLGQLAAKCKRVY